MKSLFTAKIFSGTIFFLSVIAGLAGQILLKKGTTQNPMRFDAAKPVVSAVEILLNPYLLLWIFFAGISAALWIVVVAKFELSFAYPVAMTLSYILLLILSRWLFGEAISATRWAGIVLMGAGLFLAYRS